MGNRAVVYGDGEEFGLYLHWDGEFKDVSTFLKYCALKGYRGFPDAYALPRMAQVVGNYIGGALSMGIVTVKDLKTDDPGDNGIYMVKGWKVVRHTLYGNILADDEPPAQDYEFALLKGINDSQPVRERIPEEFLYTTEKLGSKLNLGDRIILPQEAENLIPLKAHKVAEYKDKDKNGRRMLLGVPYTIDGILLDPEETYFVLQN